MEYKPIYTKEEVEELAAWFDSHPYKQELDIGSGIYMKNVSMSVAAMLHTVRAKYDNRTFSGQVYLLFRIKDELLKQGKVTD